MSRHGDLFARYGVDHALTHLGVSVTYTTRPGVATTITAALGPVRSEYVESEDGSILHKETRTCRISDGTNGSFSGISSPQKTATITVGTTVWSIEHIDAGDEEAGFPILHLVRAPVMEVNLPGNRIPR